MPRLRLRFASPAEYANSENNLFSSFSLNKQTGNALLPRGKVPHLLQTPSHLLSCQLRAVHRPRLSPLPNVSCLFAPPPKKHVALTGLHTTCTRKTRAKSSFFLRSRYGQGGCHHTAPRRSSQAGGATAAFGGGGERGKSSDNDESRGSGRWPPREDGPPSPSHRHPAVFSPGSLARCRAGAGAGLRAPPPRIATAPWREGRLWWQRRLGDKSRRNGKKYAKQNALFQAGMFVTHFERHSLISEDFSSGKNSVHMSSCLG